MTKPFHRLYNGDCIEVLRQFDNDEFDVSCADPPYCSAVKSGVKTSTTKKYTSGDAKRQFHPFEGDHRDQRSFQFWVSIWAAELHRVVRPGGACLVFSDFRNLAAVVDALQAGRWTFDGIIPWVKKTGRPRKGWFRTSAIEFVVLCSKGKQNVDAYGPHWLNYSYPAQRIHPTQKPVDLIVELLKWRPDWKSIIDPFCGSGTIFQAADQLKRNAVGIELSSHYAELSEQRSANVTRVK